MMCSSLISGRGFYYFIAVVPDEDAKYERIGLHSMKADSHFIGSDQEQNPMSWLKVEIPRAMDKDSTVVTSASASASAVSDTSPG